MIGRIFDVERYASGWDVRCWPLRWRLAYSTKTGAKGEVRRLELYRAGRRSFSVERWRSVR